MNQGIPFLSQNSQQSGFPSRDLVLVAMLSAVILISLLLGWLSGNDWGDTHLPQVLEGVAVFSLFIAAMVKALQMRIARLDGQIHIPQSTGFRVVDGGSASPSEYQNQHHEEWTPTDDPTFDGGSFPARRGNTKINAGQ